MTTALLLAHPNFAASRANRALLAGVQDLPDLEIAELYALYPDRQIDIAAERERLLRADRLVLQFPLYWYSTPPLLKQWFDEVLTPILYKEPDVVAALAGLPLLAATTTGGVAGSYEGDNPSAGTIDELFAPLRATARKIGWQWQKPFALFDIRNQDDAGFARAGAAYRATIAALPKLEPRLRLAS
ncbi:NAD(P)H-dependent oxidoreductase [Rhodopseudomonas sp. B29]|uniref:NAD(P)H-dependent oxidoreductase n=1 Tax=Rhodopseudomonas sp. B29 TaxID=95607 RepID=UPI00034AA60C|nr:NAD(P)H-dependent oxidoreductase [Rhodopseudomonas sp. B29]